MSDPRRCVHLEGPPFERGVTYGRTLKAEINELVALWKQHLAGTTGMAADDFIARFLSQTDYVSAIERYTPDLLEEVKGIAVGSGLDADTMFTFQLLDELILNSRDVAAHCSAIGVDRTAGKPTLMGQNWDIEGYVHGFQTVLHIRDASTDIESYLFAYAGLLAAFGVNNRGVGVCLNSMPILSYAREGLPVAYVIRGILAAPTGDDAVRFATSVQHASPQNYLIGDPEKVVDLECSSGEVERLPANGAPGVVFHTNHPIENDDYSSEYLNILLERERGERSDEDLHAAVEFLEANSGTRLEGLQQQLDSLPAGAVTAERIKTILASHVSAEHPICMDLIDEDTLASIVSTVMELSDEPRFHVAFGPPDVTPYTTYTFSDAG
jgi:isopenicillin-N N-acyltransferase-like protein